MTMTTKAELRRLAILVNSCRLGQLRAKTPHLAWRVDPFAIFGEEARLVHYVHIGDQWCIRLHTTMRRLHHWNVRLRWESALDHLGASPSLTTDEAATVSQVICRMTEGRPHGRALWADWLEATPLVRLHWRENQPAIDNLRRNWTPHPDALGVEALLSLAEQHGWNPALAPYRLQSSLVLEEVYGPDATPMIMCEHDGGVSSAQGKGYLEEVRLFIFELQFRITSWQQLDVAWEDKGEQAPPGFSPLRPCLNLE